MVSPRLDALIRDPVERTYLAADDGYWADMVLELFGFLEGRGGRLDVIALHQKGDCITYVGPWGDVTLEVFPDNYPTGPWIFAQANLRGDQSTFVGDVTRLAHERLPAVVAPVSNVPRPRHHCEPPSLLGDRAAYRR